MKRLSIIVLLFASTFAIAQTPVLNGQSPVLFMCDSQAAQINLPSAFGTSKPYYQGSIGGITMLETTVWYAYRVRIQHVGGVVMWCGTNDIGREGVPIALATAAAKAFIDDLIAAKLKIIIVTLPPTAPGVKPLADLQTYNQFLRDYAASKASPLITVVDLYSAMVGPDGYVADPTMLRDGLHLSSKGLTTYGIPMLKTGLEAVGL